MVKVIRKPWTPSKDIEPLLFDLSRHVPQIQRALGSMRLDGRRVAAIILPAAYEPLATEGMTLLGLPVVVADVEKVGIMLDVEEL